MSAGTTPRIPISFLVPAYNGGDYLIEAIGSISDQLVEGDEVLVQDGASKDGSPAKLAEHFAHAEWLKIVSEPDEGQSDALHRALGRAENDYVMWLNADDVVYPGALDAVRSGLAKDHPDILAGRSTIFDNSGRIIRTYTPGPITRQAFLGHGSDLFTGSLAMRTQLVRDAGGFNAKYQYCMDVDMISRLAEREPSVSYIPDVVGGLRWHDASKGGSTVWPIVTEGFEIKMRLARTPAERVRGTVSSAAYLVAALAQPIRHSAAYSKVLGRFSRRHAPTDVSP